MTANEASPDVTSGAQDCLRQSISGMPESSRFFGLSAVRDRDFCDVVEPQGGRHTGHSYFYQAGHLAAIESQLLPPRVRRERLIGYNLLAGNLPRGAPSGEFMNL